MSRVLTGKEFHEKYKDKVFVKSTNQGEGGPCGLYFSDTKVSIEIRKTLFGYEIIEHGVHYFDDKTELGYKIIEHNVHCFADKSESDKTKLGKMTYQQANGSAIESQILIAPERESLTKYGGKYSISHFTNHV